MQAEMKEPFGKSDIPEVIRLMDKHFGTNNYSLWHLFKDEQRKVLNEVLRSTLDGIEVSFRDLYEKNYPIMSFLQSIRAPLPKPFPVVSEYVANLDLRRILEEEDLDPEKFERLIQEIKKWSLEIDRTLLAFVATSRIDSLMEKLSQDPEEILRFQKIERVLKLLTPLSIDVNLWKAVNAYFSIEKRFCGAMREKAERGDDSAKSWVEAFHRLGSYLHVKVS